MIRLQINPDFAALLSAHGLAGYEDFMTFRDGEPIEENDERDVRRLDLGGRAFYLKRVVRERTSVAIETYLGGRLAHGKPYREMQHFRCLRERGFAVAEIAAVGEELRYGIPRCGFILTHEVAGSDLLRLFRDSGDQRRLAIARRFGDLVGRLHAQGFFGSIRLKDVISTDPGAESMGLILIDREVRSPFPRRPTRKLAMSRLLLNFRRQVQQGEIFSARELEAFVEHYRRGLQNRLQVEPGLIRRELDRILRKAAAD